MNDPLVVSIVDNIHCEGAKVAQVRRLDKRANACRYFHQGSQLEDKVMDAIRQIYEKLPEVITVPAEMRDRRVEVILLPLEEEPDVEALAAELGMKPEEIADPHALRFAGCLPDFPTRGPQGEYPARQELDLE